VSKRKPYLVKNYEIFTGNDLRIADRIQRLRYMILVHSCIYYILHDNLVEDYQWDRWAKELVELQKSYPYISEKVMLYDAFADFDGSTGFDLPIEEDWVIRIADKLLYKLPITPNAYMENVKRKLKEATV